MDKTETDVHTVLLTHGHADHWRGTAAFPEAEVYIHEADKGLQLEEEQEQGFFRKLMMRFLLGKLERPGIAGYFSDGDELEFDGERFRVISIPGHTEGSVAFLWRDILFIGDSVQKSGEGMRLAPEMFSADVDRIKRELPKLLDYDFEVIAPAHSGVFPDGRAALERFLSI
jgi:glyoxylase-like metal-dependent hydrolase (beta-lactamase superfamily II)